MLCRKNIYELLAGALLLVLMVSCKQELAHEGEIVFTQVPANTLNVDGDNVAEFRYTEGMQIVLADIAEGANNLISLTSDFHSARAPEISYDCKSMVFSGQKSPQDSWQIWVKDLTSGEVQQVTESMSNCTDPTWAPDGSIVYSKIVNESQDNLKHHALFRIGSDGCCDERISFQPHEDLDATFLNDGRLIVRSTQIFPEQGNSSYLAMRPDGTKAELFYQPDNDKMIQGSAIDDFSGNVVFCESGGLSKVNFNRPLHSRQVVSSAAFEYIHSTFPLGEENYLISGMKDSEHSLGIAVINDSGEIIRYFNDADFHSFEPALVGKRPRGKKLPSRVNVDLESGYLVCVNADDSQLALDGKKIKSERIQVLGMDRVVGELPIEEDGSFYLELKADVPVRLQTVDADGEIVRGPSSWMWVRPNERRGCVGCHANPEYAPDNVVPKAIEKAPFAMVN